MQWAKEGVTGAKARPYGVLQATVKVYGHEKPQKVLSKGVTNLGFKKIPLALCIETIGEG